MTARSTSLVRLGFVVCALSAARCGMADDVETQDSPIEFQLVPERESFDAEQGVWLTAFATNISREPVTFVWGDYPYEDLYEFEIVRPDGVVTPPPRRRLLPPVEALTSRDVKTLAPGESCERTIVLGIMYGGNLQAFRFLYPGQYLIRARFQLLLVREAPDQPVPFESVGPAVTLEHDELEVAIVGRVPDPTLFFSMTGQVVDSRGEPVPNVQIDVEAQQESFGSIDGVSWHRIDRVVTDSDGEYAVEGLDRGVVRHRLLFDHPEHPFHAQEFVTGANEGIIENDPVTLPDGYSIEGIVTDADGAPIPGVRVSPIFQRDLWTNIEGRFIVTGFHSAIEELETPPPNLQAWKRGWVESGTPQIVSIDGELLLQQVLVPEAEQQVSGVARFTDGTPAGNLDLYVYRAPSDGYAIETMTDAHGRFTIDWPESAERSDHGIVAVLEKDERHLPRRAWTTAFSDVNPEAPEVEFVFDNSRQLHLNVLPSNELPESATMTVNVYLKMVGNRNQWLFEEHLPSTGGRFDWERLSPGDYVVTVRIDGAEHWNWTETVSIDPDGEALAECRFRLPEMLFGDATVQVVTSDGEPWRGGTLWMDSSQGWGPLTVRNGRAELFDVPAGPIHIEVHHDGYARTHLHGEIVAGESVDLGTLEALTLAEGTGLVVGRVLLAGGGPALGARVEVEGGSYGRAPHEGGTAVDGDGLFEIRLDPGRQTIGVKLDPWDMPEVGAINDVSVSGGSLMHSQRRINAAVDVVAGEETQVEITIPALTGEVEIQGEIRSALIYLPMDEATAFEDMTGWHDPSITTTTFRRLPSGMAQVAISRALPETLFPDSQGFRHVWEHHWVEVGAEPAVVELAEMRIGRLLVTLEREGFASEAQYSVKAAPLFDDLPDEVQAVWRPEDVRAFGAYVEGESGVLYLTPGRYEIIIESWGATTTHEVEIREGETVELSP